MLFPDAAWRILAVLLFAFGAVGAAADWPMFRGNAQRTAFYPEFPAGKLVLAWRKELWRELTGPRAEVIVAGGLAYLGTYAGHLYAWDAKDGTQKWKVTTGGPIGHSVAVAEGVVYCGSMDGTLRALDAATGVRRWEYTAGSGFWTAPLVGDGAVFLGSRDGVFHAVSAKDGTGRWSFATEGPILQSAALSETGKEVLIASEDMHLYCLDAANGALRWKSRKLAGLSARDYAPVIAGGFVFVTTNPAKDFHATLGEHEKMLVDRTGFTGKDKRYIPGTEADVEEEQKFIVTFLREHPDEQTFYAFKVADGTESWIAPILYTGGLHNPPSPPCVNRDSGEVFAQLRSAYGIWDGGGEVRSFTCFGRINLATGRVPLVQHGYPSKEADRPPGAGDVPWGSFNYIGDETQTLSCAPKYLFSNHQGFLGAFALQTGRVANLFGKRDTYGGFYGPGTFGWEDKGGLAKAREAGQPFGIVNEWHGPARGVAAVADGRVYYHTGAQVLCFAPQP
jgi:outer membrane protein assembly factor BamB